MPIAKGKTIHMGICSVKGDGALTEDDIIKCADLKLYEAKSSGRNRVVA